MALLCGRRDPKRKILEVQKLLIDGSKICLLECGHKQIARPQKQRFGGYRPMQKKVGMQGVQQGRGRGKSTHC